MGGAPFQNLVGAEGGGTLCQKVRSSEDRGGNGDPLAVACRIGYHGFEGYPGDVGYLPLYARPMGLFSIYPPSGERRCGKICNEFMKAEQ